MNTDKSKITIAIDGYSSSGKSTMAKHLASEIGYRYIDSGAMYRAVTLFAMRHNMIDRNGAIDTEALIKALPAIRIDFRPTDGGQITLLNDEDVEKEIRSLAVSSHVSEIAAIPSVRHALVAMQQAFGREGGIVMDGRDIGTTVFPNAELKIFVNASAETRAQRRLAEMLEKGANVSFEEVLANVVHRDHIDETREESPLRKADDALLLDNSTMSPEEQNSLLMEMFRNALNRQA